MIGSLVHDWNHCTSVLLYPFPFNIAQCHYVNSKLYLDLQVKEQHRNETSHPVKQIWPIGKTGDLCICQIFHAESKQRRRIKFLNNLRAEKNDNGSWDGAMLAEKNLQIRMRYESAHFALIVHNYGSLGPLHARQEGPEHNNKT